MKNMKRLLAVLLSVLMCLSCLAGLSFADEVKTFSTDRIGSKGETKQTTPEYSFDDAEVQPRSDKGYADDDIVTVIVLLDGKSPAELPEAQRSAASTRVAAQHNALRNALRNAGINFAEEFEYDSLLNGLAISVAFGDLAKIRSIDGVRKAFVAVTYETPVLEPADRMASSNVMTGVADFQTAGFTGKGTVIAVLDTGITPAHEAFQVYGDVLADAAFVEEDMNAFIAEKGYGKYLSEKIPFSYDYADGDDDATDDTSGHGTHVSGIAAGFVMAEDGAVTFSGTAPFAQIVAMKIFSSGVSGTNSGIYFAALEDAYELGVDVINMSIGHQNGNVYDPELESEEFGNIFQILDENGIIVSCSAGNEDSMAEHSSNWAGSGVVTSDYADYGVTGSPASYDGNMSVASVDNAEYPGYVIHAGDKDIGYTDNSDDGSFLATLGGQEDLEYVVIDGFGEEADYAGVDVAGKLALVSRGSCTFSEKVKYAAKAGAIGLIVYNNQAGSIGMMIDNYYIPAVSILQEDGEYLKSIAVMPEEEEPTPDPEPTPEPEPTIEKGRRSSGNTLNVARKATDARKVVTRDVEALASGKYLIVNLDGTKAFNGGAGEGINATGNYIALTDTTSDEELAAAALTYNSEDGSFQTSDGKYISGEDGANKLVLSDTPVANEVSFTEEGAAVITNNNTQFAFNSGWDGFRFYKSTSSLLTAEDSAVILVPLSDEPITPPEPPISEEKGVLVGWYFESEDEIADWTIVDADDDGYGWYIDDENEAAYEGTGTIFSLSWDDDPLIPDDWAITPAIDLDGIEDAELSLWYNSDPDYPEDVFAVYGGTSADPDAMTKLTDDITATGTWTNLRVDLADYAGETIYLAIRHYNCTDMDYLDIDNVEILTASVEPIAPPEPPENVIACWDFETEPGDWTFVDKDEDGFNWNWTVIDPTQMGQMTPYEGNGLIYSESYSNDEEEALTPDNWAISPAIDLDGIEESTLTLWAEGQDADWCDEVFALYAGTTADPDAMTKLTDDITATGEYMRYTADLSDFAGEKIYIAIRHYNVTDQFILNIDLVEIYDGKAPIITEFLEEALEIAKAVDPEGYSEESYAALAAAIEAAEAVLAKEDVTQEEIDAALAALNDALANLAKQNPLGGEAVYGWYFESEDEVADWSIYDADGDGDCWYLGTSDNSKCYEGDGCLVSASYYYGALTPDNWAITPAIDLDGIEDAVLSFFYIGQDPNYAAENFGVFIGTEEDTATMKQIGFDETAGTEYQQFVADLSEYAGETVYIAIRHYNVTDMFRLNVDNFEIRTGTNFEPPVPPEPVARPVGTLSVPTEIAIIANPTGWEMSSFSSWGCTPSLTLKPMISGVGGMVNAAEFGTTDGYVLYSGTSMSSPNVAGVMALVSQYLNETFGLVEEPAPEQRDGENENPFTDVSENDYFFEPVLWAVDNGITTGTDPGKFSPNAKCTRGQVVTFLWRAFGQPAVEGENPFNDVKADDYFYNAVLWAVSKEITTGTDPGKFSPNGKCTRGQVVTFLWRAADKPEPATTENPFDDVKADDYFYSAVLWAVENEITNGTDPGKFSPNAKCTRGQVVTFLYRALANGEPIGALTKVERAELAEKLAQSTALILPDTYGTAYSPRKQGAGLVNMSLLSAANAYITEPIQNLFDNEGGEFEFTFTVKDLYGNGGTYQVTPIVLTDYADKVAFGIDENGEYILSESDYNYFSALELATEPYEYNGTEYPADVDVEAPETVTVPKNGKVDVTVKIKLTDETKAYLDEKFPNGTYIEGFIVLDAADENGAVTEEIHATYMGFYGDWTKGPILETYDWRDVLAARDMLASMVAYTDEDGNEVTYADLGYTWENLLEYNTGVNYAYVLNYDFLMQWYQAYGIACDIDFMGQFYNYLLMLGYGGLAGDNPLIDTPFNEDRIVINNAGTSDFDTLWMIPYLIRNTRHIIMVVTDAETGEVYNVDDTEYLTKTEYDEDYYSFWEPLGYFKFDGYTDAGEALPDGTKVDINYYANLMYGEDELGAIIGEEGDYSKLAAEAQDYLVWSYGCTVDNTAPEIVGEPVIDEDAGTITVTVKDAAYVAGILVYNDEDDLIDYYIPDEAEAGAETEVSFEYGDAQYVYFELIDYAMNESDPIVAYIGEPVFVTMNFSYPEGMTLVDGEDEVVALAGSVFTFPDLEGETEQGEFIGWYAEELPELTDGTEMDASYASAGLKTALSADLDGITWHALFEVVVADERESDPIYGWYFESDPAEEGWTFVDADEDGYCWEWLEDFKAYEGVGTLSSASYINGTGALTPDNWAISPAIDLTEVNEATLSLWAIGQDTSYYEENFAIYAGEEADPETMTQISADITAEGEYVNYCIDLSDFAGKTVYVAIRHYDVTDMFWLNVDAVEVFDSKVEPLDPPEYFYTTNPNGELTPPDPGPVVAPFTLLSADQLEDQEYVIIVNPDAMKAISNADSDAENNPERYRLGVDVALEEDGRIWTDALDIVWDANLTDDGWTFQDAEGHYLSTNSYGNLILDGEYKYWNIVDAGDMGVFLISTEAVGSSGDPRGIEFYQDKFTTYYASETNLQNSAAAFTLQLFCGPKG